jgi:two-component system NtrC family sensor kinase
VDEIKGTVYHDEKYAGRDMGVATIFQRGVRISTNVMTESNRRAIGTPVSKEVYEKVLGRGEDWIGRAFVVNDWYITTYSPIRDIDNEIIGILYTGILEAKYTDIKRRTMWTFLVVTLAGMVVAFGISYYLGNTILRRIRIRKRPPRPSRPAIWITVSRRISIRASACWMRPSTI